MKANELRIGNLLGSYNKGEEDRVLTINAQNILVEAKANNQGYTRYRPIPLTEEWLLRFGFEKNNNNQFILIKGSVDILFNKDLNGWTCDGINFSINMTEHVHQLQNLYFALTGEELTIGGHND